jgi:hypothetical protein
VCAYQWRLKRRQEIHRRRSEGVESAGRPGQWAGGNTHQISERVQLLSHERALLSPAGNLAVHEVKEHAEWHKGQGSPEVAEIVRVAHAVAERGEDRVDTTEACIEESVIEQGDERSKKGRSGILTVQEGDEVGEMHCANHGKVTRIRVFQDALLLVHG